MGLFNGVKEFFGFSKGDDNSTNVSSINNLEERPRPREHFDDEYEKMGFNVFANPVEMHKYFERQMEEVIKSFGMFNEREMIFGGDLFFGGGGGGGDQIFGDFTNLPSIDELHKPEDGGSNLREKFLKPGYETPKPNETNKVDKDLDEKFALGELDSVLKRGQSQVIPRSFFSGKTMITKTVRDPDGTWITHKTVKDHNGNEETTVIRAKGDQKCIITTKVDKEGHREVVKDMTNMEEFDKTPIPPNWFPFDKFFK